jgi:hypothetical protein
MKRVYLVLLGALAVFALSMATYFTVTGDDVVPDETATAVPHFRTADIRVQITDEAMVSRNQDPVYVQLDSGVIPDNVSLLTVLTDENCTPDQDGVSHCLNRVEYKTASGTQLAALRHHHKMSEEPCLTPGQTLELVR